MTTLHPSLLFGSRIEVQCSAGHRSWRPLEETAFVCVCGNRGARTGRTMLGAEAARDLIGTHKPGLHGVESKASADMVESYRLHVAIPTLNQFRLD